MKKTTTDQFDLLLAEMGSNVDLARGIPSFGSSKSISTSSWQSVANKLNAIGPPVRDVVGWRKV